MVRSLALLSLLALLPGALAAQADSTLPEWLRFRTAPFELRAPPALRSAWRAGRPISAAVAAMNWQRQVDAERDSIETYRLASYRLRRIYGAKAVQEQAEADSLGERNSLLGISKKYVDLNIEGLAHLELRTERLKNLRCTPAALLDPNSGCTGGFKAPRFDTQLSIRMGGLIGRRLHVNTDYDTERDFSGANNIQVYYEGLEDEVVRRVEVGTVTFVPPRSRFLATSIPANNFGINATFEVGALQLQTMAATQKGSQIAERTFVIGDRTAQPQDRQVRDLDFESGRFFWVVDPKSLPSYPAIDVLNLDPTVVPAPLRPTTQVRIYRYRPGTSKTGTNPNLGGISAVARRSDSPQRIGPLKSLWQALVPGVDYYLDPSGLWFALTGRLDIGDYLAVSYVTATGDSVGTLPTQDNPLAGDSLELIVEPKVGPQLPTFRYEMRQIYRVAGLDLDRSSLNVELSLNRSQQPQSGGSSTYLAALGLATPSDPGVLDVDNRVFPRTRDPLAALSIKESYLVFPNLTPFADSVRLTVQERSDSLYKTPLYLLLSEGPSSKFQFRLQYVSSSTGDRSTLDLNALQIRTGSERITAGGRVLERGIDYNISYDVGQVTFLSPNTLFGNDPVTVTARFEERGIFAVAPTSIFGIASTYRLGALGNINAVGIYQKEQTAFNRPPLGFEASANLVGGLSTDLHFQPNAVTRFFNRLTSTPATAPSLLDINGELAITRPDPNRSGQAYLEEFEGDNGIPVGLREQAWEFGSASHYVDGVDAVVGPVFDPADAVAFTTQNLIPADGGGVVELRPSDIDPRIQTAGSAQSFETVLYSMLHADTAGGIVQFNRHSRWSLPARPLKPRWRSIVTALSSTGVDLSKNEFLEFWIFQDGTRSADSAGVQLVVDMGTVSEDAIAIAPTTLTVVGSDSIYTGRQLVGLGRLDTEREPTGIYNAATDDNGILGDRPDAITVAGGGTLVKPALCKQSLSNVVPFFPWGDLSGRCSNGNGLLDTEDLNGDNQLDLGTTGGTSGANENVFRWVVNLKTSPYFVRDGVKSADSVGGWKLYRLPLRQPGFSLGTPNLRLIQQLRITAIAPPDDGGPDITAKFALARMRFTGSPWVRRSDSPVAGFAGSTGLSHGTVTSSIISTENVELGYVSPPGVAGGTNNAGGSRDDLGQQVNERSLRVIGEGIGLGERAESYFRFTAGPQNLLKYRNLRVWARGHGPGWDQGDFRAFIKIGADDGDFYQYLATHTSTGTWLPELVIELSQWRTLRAQVERRYLTGLPADSAARVACGGDTVSTAYVACNGPYLVYVTNPQVSPPNLAAVQEISAGIYRQAATTGETDTEVWIDDIRMDDPISTVGVTYAVSARLAASDVGDVSLDYVYQDGNFQQIDRDPTYLNTGAMQLATSWRVDRFLPASLGIAMPVGVSYSRSTTDPLLLAGTDIQAGALSNLRKPQSWSLTYSMQLRRTVRGRRWLTRTFIDPLSFFGVINRGHSQSDLNSAETHAYDYRLSYLAAPGRRGVTLSLGGLVDKLPRFLRNTDGGQSLRSPLINFVPTSIRLSSGLRKNQSDLRSFLVPVTLPGDTAFQPLTSLTSLWSNSAGITWSPLGMLTLSGDLTSTRDLRSYSDSTTLGRLAGQARRSLFGLDVGVERDRQLGTTFALTPRVTSWFQPRFLSTSRFALIRDFTSRQPIRENGDTSGGFLLPQTLNNDRRNELGASLDLARLFRKRAAPGEAPSGESGLRFRRVDMLTAIERTSTFDLPAFDPDLSYMLALGSRDRFVNREGEKALGVSETRTTTLSGGADLPLGFSMTVAYSRIRDSRLQLIAEDYLETESLQREWPSGTVRWTRAFRGHGPFALMALGVALRKRQGTTTQPSGVGAPVQTLTRSTSFTPDLSLSFRNGVGLNAAYNSVDQSAVGGGNTTSSEQHDLTTAVNYAFLLPQSFGRDRKQVRTSISALLSTNTSCLTLGSGGPCATISDLRRQEFRGGLDTDFTRTFSAGVQISYSVTDARYLDQKTQQIILLLNFTLSLFSGDYR